MDGPRNSDGRRVTIVDVNGEQLQVVWDGNGSYSPACPRCNWTGPAAVVHDDAVAAAQAHTRSPRHTGTG